MTSTYLANMEDVYRVDEEAAELIESIIVRAQRSGLPVAENKNFGQSLAASTHRAPVGIRAYKRLRLRSQSVPWIGEILVDGSGTSRAGLPEVFWRAYFTDLRCENRPDEQIDDVLMASVRGKSAGGIRRGEQDQHIVAAGDAILRWCGKHRRVTYRTQ